MSSTLGTHASSTFSYTSNGPTYKRMAGDTPNPHGGGIGSGSGGSRFGVNPDDGPDGSTGPGPTTLPVAKKPESGSGAGGTSGGTSSGGNDTNSTSPEFNALMNTLNSMAAAGAPITPPLQDNNAPVSVPTQSSSKNASLAIVLFLIAGALGYYYYRKHGGPSMHEAL